ncbi:MAG: BREX-2 system phosphatase PglZ, partial [Ruaniaceae bacterium]|nr:BREX-2 system phosphatase PglZ [Ruaniaceae bacterium]
IDIASEVGRSGLVEWVPSASKRRLAAAAALPSLTGSSRTSLFCGTIRSGDSADEKRGLAAAFPKSRVFHKGELRAAGGAQLAAAVADAIADRAVPVVGVVINAIDDAMHKNDTSTRTWTMDDLQPLRALLNAASIAGRAVILTSDHGHVVERGTTMLPAVPGGDSRWRPASSGPPVDGEVLVSGPRIAQDCDEIVLLWREDARYGATRAGYHGGAALAELTVPVLVFQRSLANSGPLGWEPAPPQTPGWWNDPVIAAAAETPMKAPAAPRKSRKKLVVDPAGPGLFELENLPASPSQPVDVVARVLESSVFADQVRLAGRAASAHLVEAVLRTLTERAGRAHQNTVAAAAGIPLTTIAQGLAVVRRVLNVEGYEILSVDSDGETLRLDVELLKDQFGVS